MKKVRLIVALLMAVTLLSFAVSAVAKDESGITIGFSQYTLGACLLYTSRCV